MNMCVSQCLSLTTFLKFHGTFDQWSPWSRLLHGIATGTRGKTTQENPRQLLPKSLPWEGLSRKHQKKS